MAYLITVIGLFALSFGIRFVVTLPLALIVMWCWDGCMPALFHLPMIRYWQAYALCLLVGILLHLDVNVKTKTE